MFTKTMSATRIIFISCLLLVLGYSTALTSPEKSVPETSTVDYVEGVVISVQALDIPEVKQSQGMGRAELVILKLTSGPETGQEVRSIHHYINMPGIDIHPNPGDKVVVAVSKDLTRKSYNIADFERLSYVYVLLGFFALALLVIGRRVGLRSLFVICFAVFIILEVMIPLIHKGIWSITAITFVISAILPLLPRLQSAAGIPKPGERYLEQ